jgi:hypothetical protein
MRIDFFETNCQEPSKSDKTFGICDDGNGTPAYTDTADATKWVAKVVNENETDVAFTAIDNCIVLLREGTNEEERSCDGMLTTAQSLYLVELKDKEKNWIADAKEQLENTIRLLSENHDISNFRYKKAFACNKKHPHFRVIDNAEQRKFFRQTGFRIDIQAEISVK